MECNKEEALRAKDIAEKKMESKDFIGARKFVLKAQQLYPEIENISQLRSVCDVHSSAEKMFGNEMDWYGILQVEQTADDTLIKKQYRKFALLLHPDKNQFVGAEAAFKLIGEAQRVLLDKQKRAIHDNKRRTYQPSIPNHQLQPSIRKAGIVKESRSQNNFTSNPKSHFNASSFPNPRAEPANGKETFWTLCLHCSVRYQYYREVLGRSLRCQSCKKTFIACDMKDSRSGPTQPVSPQQDVPCAPAGNGGSENKKVKPMFNAAGFQAGQKVEVSRSQKGVNKVDRQEDEGSKVQKSNGRFQAGQKVEVSRSQKGANKVGRQEDEGSKVQKSNGQRKRKHVESSKTLDPDSSVDSEEVEIHEVDDPRSQHLHGDGECQTKRINRKKQVSSEENANNVEQVATTSKKSKGSSSTDKQVDASNVCSAYGKESKKKECNTYDKNEAASHKAHDGLDSSLDSISGSSPDSPPTYVEYPDPEFYDFEKNREQQCFKVGQVWAAYDTVDAMPRFYAKIKKIYASGFKLQITWLEPDPDDVVGIEWTDSDLPFPCGKFTIGDTDITEDRLMFSHVVSGCQSSGRNSFVIYPKVGETWAIFKNWDVKWCSVPENERKFEYEYVEIMSEYDKIVGIRVASLGKLKGFASLFHRISVDEIQVGPSELLRFSHMVPSYKTTGNERVDVPKGSIELDPAATTMNLEEITLSQPERKNYVDNISSKLAGDMRVIVSGIPAGAFSDNNIGNKVKHQNGLK